MNTTDIGWESRYDAEVGPGNSIDAWCNQHNSPLRAKIKDFIRREIQRTAKEEYERGRKDLARELMRGPAHEDGSPKAYKQIDVEVLEAALETQP